MLLVSAARLRSKNFPVFSDLVQQSLFFFVLAATAAMRGKCKWLCVNVHKGSHSCFILYNKTVTHEASLLLSKLISNGGYTYCVSDILQRHLSL